MCAVLCDGRPEALGEMSMAPRAGCPAAGEFIEAPPRAGCPATGGFTVQRSFAPALVAQQQGYCFPTGQRHWQDSAVPRPALVAQQRLRTQPGGLVAHLRLATTGLVMQQKQMQARAS